MVEDASAALDILDGLTGLMEGGDLNVINAFSKSSANLLVDGLSDEDIAAMQASMAAAEDGACKATDCNNGGLNGNTSRCSTTPGKHCDCAAGFSGYYCKWNEASKVKAEGMVRNALTSLKNVGDLSERGSSQGIESMSSLTKDPDMVNDDTTNLTLDAMNNTANASLAGHYPNEAAKSLSNCMSNQKGGNKAKKADGGAGLDAELEKEQNERMMSVTGGVMDSSDEASAGGEGVMMETPLIKGNKKTVQIGDPISAMTSSGGLMMDSSALGRILTANGADDEGLNAQALQFDTNT